MIRPSVIVPTAPIDTGRYGTFAGSVSADSGPIAVTFNAGTPLALIVTPGGLGPGSSFCSAYEINVSIQYQ